MKVLVIDNSVIMSWFVVNERPLAALKILEQLNQSRAYMPALWGYEFINSLYVVNSLRKNELTLPIDEIIKFMISLPMEMVNLDLHDLFLFVHPLCLKYKVSAYDASYLALAKRMSCPLATLDEKLIKVCHEEKIPLAIREK